MRRAIQNKRRGTLNMGIILLHDNAKPHTENQTQELIRSFAWEQVGHPPYSTKLAPNNFHLFSNLKNPLGKQRQDDVDDVKMTVL